MAATPPPQAPPTFADFLLPTPAQHVASSPYKTHFPKYHEQNNLFSPIPQTLARPTAADQHLHLRVRSAESHVSSSALDPFYSSKQPTPVLRQNGLEDTTSIMIGDQSAPSWQSAYPDQGEDLSDFVDFEHNSPAKIVPPSTPMSASDERGPFSSPLSGAQTKRRRQLSGLGTPTAQRGTKRTRQATLDANSMPLSPTRRKREPSTSFTTSMPLPSRSASTSSASHLQLRPTTYTADRNVSTASTMTASTAILSPTLAVTVMPYPVGEQFGMPASSSLTSMPDLGGSNYASPNMSTGQSPNEVDTPLAGSSYPFASPDMDAGFFADTDIQAQGEMNLMSNVMSAMPSSHHMSTSRSSSLNTVDSFAAQQIYQNTLSTINEDAHSLPIPEDVRVFYGDNIQQGLYPPRQHIEQSSQFQHAEYPAAPGMQVNFSFPDQSQPHEIHTWAQQAQQAYEASVPHIPQLHHPLPQVHYGLSQPVGGPSIARTVSYSHFQQQQMQLADLHNYAPGPIQRSVSVPHIHMSSMSADHQQSHQQPFPSMPSHMSHGGLFPAHGQSHGALVSSPSPELQQGEVFDSSLYENDPARQGGEDAAEVSDVTDSPCKRRRQASKVRSPPMMDSDNSSPEEQNQIQALTRGHASAESAESQLMSASQSSQSSAGGYPPAPIRTGAHSTVHSPTAPAPRLEFGPSLPTLSINIQPPPKSTYDLAPLSASSSSALLSASFAPEQAPALFPPAAAPSAQAIAGPSTIQPTLIIDPPRQIFPAENNPSGLPKNFLEKLYTTYLTLDGATTGQPVKRFRCLIEGCERNFPRKSAIHSHIQTHLEDKPFTCPEPDCAAAFVRQHDLRRHARIHSAEKPYGCACGKGFARGDALIRHRQRGICIGKMTERELAEQAANKLHAEHHLHARQQMPHVQVRQLPSLVSNMSMSSSAPSLVTSSSMPMSNSPASTGMVLGHMGMTGMGGMGGGMLPAGMPMPQPRVAFGHAGQGQGQTSARGQGQHM